MNECTGLPCISFQASAYAYNSRFSSLAASPVVRGVLANYLVCLYRAGTGFLEHGGKLRVWRCVFSELELELIHTQMAQKPMLRAEVEMRVRCANKASAEVLWPISILIFIAHSSESSRTSHQNIVLCNLLLLFLCDLVGEYNPISSLILSSTEH